MTAVLTLKTQRKLILSHLKNRCRTKPIGYKFVCHENVFCYLDFRSYLKAYYQKSLPFALKSTFTFEIHCKKHLIPTPKTNDRKKPRAIDQKYVHSRRIFIDMPHLYGTRGDYRGITKIWAKIISAYGKKCSITGFSSLRGGGGGKKRKYTCPLGA